MRCLERANGSDEALAGAQFRGVSRPMRVGLAQAGWMRVPSQINRRML